MPLTLLYIAIGGALGSVARFLAMSAVGLVWRSEFPYGTLVVNVFGSFCMGVLIDALARFLPQHQADLRAFIAVGVLGGFTTFSTFSLDVVVLFEHQNYAQALLYILASVILSVAALGGALALMRMIPA